jgi:CHAT domain-containing protein
LQNQARTEGRYLYDLLLGPFANELRTTTRLFFVPAGRLTALPLGSLISPSGEAVRHSLTVATSPSLRFLTRRGAHRPSNEGILLSVGYAGDAHDLPRLTEAESEARAVAAIATDPVLLVGPMATKEAFLAGLPDARLVHFAGHALLNPEQPRDSRLLLAGGDAAFLTAREIRQLRLRRAPLVVLSACATSVSGTQPGDEASSLAHAFLAAGASAVIGTLWPVSDRSATRFVSRLYGLISAGETAPSALRTAQGDLAELVSDAHAFQAFSGANALDQGNAARTGGWR